MKKAIEKDPKIIYGSDIYQSKSALHFAATSPNPSAAHAVQWLLEKGIPWSAHDSDSHIPEDLAVISGNKESRKVLRDWAVQQGIPLFKINKFKKRAASSPKLYACHQNISYITIQTGRKTTRTKENLSGLRASMEITRTMTFVDRRSFSPTQTERQKTRWRS